MGRLNLELLQRYDRVVAEHSTEPRERQAARAIGRAQADEANSYVRPVAKPAHAWQRVSPELAVLITIALAVLVSAGIRLWVTR